MRMPSKPPTKILIAFLDKDDNVEWCAKLRPDHIEMSMEANEVPTMQLELPLIEAD